jgi:CSLREA domain-containing protein
MREFILGLLCLSIAILPARAATIIVDTTIDDNTINGNCSLREALAAANTNTSKDNCTAGSGADVIVVAVSGTLFITSDLPQITESVTILGPGADLFTISGQLQYRPLTFFGTVVQNTSTVKGIRIFQGGDVTGGGILVGQGAVVNLYYVVRVVPSPKTPPTRLTTMSAMGVGFISRTMSRLRLGIPLLPKTKTIRQTLPITIPMCISTARPSFFGQT